MSNIDLAAPSGSAGALAGAMRALVGRGVSVKEYGAKGDGTTDDSAAILAAMVDCFADRKKAFVHFPPGDYKVAAEIAFTYAGNVTWRHGLLFEGACLVSTINNAAKDVIRITSSGTVNRFLRIDGLVIAGAGTERDGLSLVAATTSDFIYNFQINAPSIEGCGRDGIRIAGNCFEGSLYEPFLRNNLGNGLTWGHHASGGIASATNVFGGSLGQNGSGSTGNGAEVINNAYDIRFFGTYFLENRCFGLVALNGFSLVSGGGSENNWKSRDTFATGYGGIGFQNFGTVVAHSGASNTTGQSALINGYIVSRLSLTGHCTMTGSGAAAAAELANVSGAAGSEYHQEIESWVAPSTIDSAVLAFVGKRAPSKTVALLPTASGHTGRTILVTDASGGAMLCFSNGSAWKRVDTGATVTT